MSSLKKLTIKTVIRRNTLTPTEIRRKKLISKIDEQFNVLDAAIKMQDYKVTRQRWAKDEKGERVRQDIARKIRAWFFEQDGGYFVQCKYGSRALQLSKEGNAVFAKQLADVKQALEAFRQAAMNGELDGAIEALLSSRKTKLKKAA